MRPGASRGADSGEPRRALRLLAGTLLLFDGLSSAVGVASALPTLAAQGPAALGAIALRGLVGAFEATGGYLLLARNPSAAPIARVGVILAAVYATIGIGARLAPTNLDPAFRHPVVVGYWAYALIMLSLLRRF